MENRLVLYSVTPGAAGVPGSCPRDESRLAEEARGQRDPNLRRGRSGDGPESTRFPEARSRGSGGGPGAWADALGVRCALGGSATARVSLPAPPAGLVAPLALAVLRPRPCGPADTGFVLRVPSRVRARLRGWASEDAEAALVSAAEVRHR